MSLQEQVTVWEREYKTLYQQNARSLHLLSQCRGENAKMEETNKLGLKLVENLKKQISKYRDSDQYGDDSLDPNTVRGYTAASPSSSSSSKSTSTSTSPSSSSSLSERAEDEDADKWRDRYLAEKRASEYLRAEVEDLQMEMEELKEKKMEAAAVHEAWEEEVTALFERLKANNVDTDHLFDAVQRNLSRMDINRKDVIGDGMDYKTLYEQSVVSKLVLIEQTSTEIQRLREVIKDQNPETFKNVLDKIARYHNLDGTEDTLFQLVIDVKNELKK